MMRIVRLIGLAVALMADISASAALPDTIDLGRGPQGELCRAERTWSDPAAPGLFDTSFNVRCRGWTETASVGRYHVVAATADATALLDKSRDARLACGAPIAVTVAGLGVGTARRCVAREAGYEAIAVQVAHGGKIYAVDGLKRFADNLATGLRSVGGAKIGAKGAGKGDALVPADAPPPPAGVALAAVIADESALGDQRTEVLDYSIRGQHGEAREIVTRYLAKLPLEASRSDRINLTLDAALSESNLGYRDVAKVYLDQAAALLDAAEAPRGLSGDRLRSKLQVYRAIDALNRRDYPAAATLSQAALAEDRDPVRLASLDNAPLRDPAVLRQLNTNGASRGLGSRDLSWIGPVVLQAEALYVRSAALVATGAFAEASVVLAQDEKLLSRFDNANLETSNLLWLRSAVAAERGRIATHLGDFATARKAYAESTDRLDRSTIYTDTPLVAQRRLDYAGFLARQGDRKEARVQYERALDVLKRAGPSTSSGVSGLEGYFGVLAADIAAGGTGADSARAQFFLASQFIAPPAVAAQIAQIEKIFESGSSDAAVRAKALQDLDRESRVLATRLASLPETAAKDRAAVRAELDVAEARAVQVRTELAGDQQYQQASDTIATLGELQAALKPGEAYVKLLTLPATTYVIVATHGASAVYPAGLPTAELAKLAVDVRSSIDGNIAADGRVIPLVFDIPGAFKLHEALLGPGRDLLAGVTTLITEPTGAMTQLPFGVLVVDQASVDGFAISVMKNSRDYSQVKFLASTVDLDTTVSPRSFLVARTQKASGATLPYLGFGYHAVPNATELAAVPNRGSFAGRCAGRADALRQGFASLRPIGAKELAAAAAVMGPGSKLVEGADFSDSALTANNASTKAYRDYAVIHFATHGLKEGELDCDSPPALVTSISDSPNSDGLLSFEEIANLGLDANLVVLSACNTAAETTASRASGSGIRVRQGQAQTLNGLVRAFLVAGSRAVLTTHWAIPDGFKTRDGRQVAASTQLVETLFKSGATKSIGDSLRAAQSQMIRNPDTSHPYYWGAFALVGDGAKSMLARAS
ncbi:CHAT domain-containing protein [Glacieibacterium megasporae]|uniref:CHAT domain-containing protein n=1 Tax=Glacieibacterium megasporae TaxID=2835787 RepID=UPI001C1E16B8|nr:CHAT domain-containing tetratricopeptide repeat protein [Polymorphobacter megasporae]UAJ09840.1 CHAT domain-containing protein [Polymorphobacter megasporae]